MLQNYYIHESVLLKHVHHILIWDNSHFINYTISLYLIIRKMDIAFQKTVI